MHEVAEFLANTPPFDTLERSELERVADACEIEFHPAGGTILLQASEPPEHVWIVRRGVVELVDNGRVVDQLGEHEMFGHNTMLTGGLVGVAVRAHEDTLCYRLPGSVIREVLGRPAALRYLVHSAGGSYELRDGHLQARDRVDLGQRRVGDLVRGARGRVSPVHHRETGGQPDGRMPTRRRCWSTWATPSGSSPTATCVPGWWPPAPARIPRSARS